MKQSRLMSLVEALTNILVGFWLAVGVQFLIFPWFDLVPTFSSSIGIGIIFTLISLARSYALRRVFEAIRMRGGRDAKLR